MRPCSTCRKRSNSRRGFVVPAGSKPAWAHLQQQQFTRRLKASWPARPGRTRMCGRAIFYVGRWPRFCNCRRVASSATKRPPLGPLKSSRSFLVVIRRISGCVLEVARNVVRCSLRLIHFPFRLHQPSGGLFPGTWLLLLPFRSEQFCTDIPVISALCLLSNSFTLKVRAAAGAKRRPAKNEKHPS